RHAHGRAHRFVDHAGLRPGRGRGLGLHATLVRRHLQGEGRRVRKRWLGRGEPLESAHESSPKLIPRDRPMAGSVNKVILVGNLGRDPEVRSFNNGGKVCNLSIATSESWRDKATGERKDRTEWHRVAIFNERLAEVAEKYLKKGAKIYIEGQLETRKW